MREDPEPRPWLPKEAGLPGAPPQRKLTTVQRIVRNTAVATQVKALHDYTCQVCGIRLNTPGGPYAEGAHIQALGTPHNGPDVLENLLCLCPNHHVLFDGGALFVQDDLQLDGYRGRLRTAAGHTIALEYLQYHRNHTIKALEFV